MIMQHDSLHATETVVVAPCVAAASGPKEWDATPIVEISGRDYRVLVPELAAIPRRALGNRPITNLVDHRDAFTAAIDRLFTGI